MGSAMAKGSGAPVAKAAWCEQEEAVGAAFGVPTLLQTNRPTHEAIWEVLRWPVCMPTMSLRFRFEMVGCWSLVVGCCLLCVCVVGRLFGRLVVWLFG